MILILNIDKNYVQLQITTLKFYPILNTNTYLIIIDIFHSGISYTSIINIMIYHSSRSLLIFSACLLSIVLPSII